MSYDVFKDLCKKKGVTPAEVSRATGVATSTLTEWKKGRYVPKADKLAKIADYFGVSVEYLMTGAEPEGYYVNPETAEVEMSELCSDTPVPHTTPASATAAAREMIFFIAAEPFLSNCQTA